MSQLVDHIKMDCSITKMLLLICVMTPMIVAQVEMDYALGDAYESRELNQTEEEILVYEPDEVSIAPVSQDVITPAYHPVSAIPPEEQSYLATDSPLGATRSIKVQSDNTGLPVETSIQIDTSESRSDVVDPVAIATSSVEEVSMATDSVEEVSMTMVDKVRFELTSIYRDIDPTSVSTNFEVVPTAMNQVEHDFTNSNNLTNTSEVMDTTNSGVVTNTSTNYDTAETNTSTNYTVVTNTSGIVTSTTDVINTSKVTISESAITNISEVTNTSDYVTNTTYVTNTIATASEMTNTSYLTNTSAMTNTSNLTNITGAVISDNTTPSLQGSIDISETYALQSTPVLLVDSTSELLDSMITATMVLNTQSINSEYLKSSALSRFIKSTEEYMPLFGNVTPSWLFPVIPPSPPPLTVSKTTIVTMATSYDIGTNESELDSGNSSDVFNNYSATVEILGTQLLDTMVTASVHPISDIISSSAMTTASVTMTTVPPLKDLLMILTFSGNCTALQESTETSYHFKKILVGLLSQMLDIDINQITVPDLKCGSVDATVLIKTKDPERIIKNVGSIIDDKRLYIDINTGHYMCGKMTVIPLGGKKPFEPAPVEKVETGFNSLSHTDRVIIISTTIIIASLCIMGAVMCFRECHARRKSQSFDLGETPAVCKPTDEFSLKKMNRPPTIYNDDGSVSPVIHEIPNIIPMSEVQDFPDVPYYGKYLKSSDVVVHDLTDQSPDRNADSANSRFNDRPNEMQRYSTENLISPRIETSNGVDNPIFVDDEDKL
ncbi:unnamed protein product [Owenia fusiformis]|uniref:Uncharacterized protein n=1 Tax=Owenia fusiformis TaxID=6347 RepID=A0A8J1TG96_OWEFU|nr:unnamed protein product [Owenia fusiformis]